MASNPKLFPEMSAPLFAAKRSSVPVSEQDLLDGRVSSAMADPLLEKFAREVLQIIWMHRGARNAIKAEDILLQLVRPVNENSRREIKGAVEDLVTRLRVPIGGSRQKPYGYFLIVTAADHDLAIQPLRHEMESLIRRLRALTSKEDVARMFGQMILNTETGDIQPRKGQQK
jgi:hypothetical protein